MFKNHGKIERIQDYNDKQFFDYIFGKKLEEKIVQLTELINSKDIFERYQLA
ncbi:MAG: hypothetical protein RJA52_1178, partial [Bacteroidota bacterium]